MSELFHTRSEVEAMHAEHNPAEQDHGYEGRCDRCHFTRSPCDMASLAHDWLLMADIIEGRKS